LSLVHACFPVCLFIFFAHSYQKAAERGGYGDERYEKLEFQKKVAEHYKVLHDASWKVMNCFSGLFILN
jgi:dTMP kinase